MTIYSDEMSLLNSPVECSFAYYSHQYRRTWCNKSLKQQRIRQRKIKSILLSLNVVSNIPSNTWYFIVSCYHIPLIFILFCKIYLNSVFGWRTKHIKSSNLMRIIIYQDFLLYNIPFIKGDMDQTAKSVSRVYSTWPFYLLYDLGFWFCI